MSDSQKWADMPIEEQYSCFDRMSVEALFADFTLISSQEAADTIREKLLKRDWLVSIDKDPDSPFWIWHWAFKMNDCITLKKKCHGKFLKFEPREQIEKGIESSICSQLTKRGIECSRQVGCGGGIIDILTPYEIYEVKAVLRRTEVLKAICQVLVYRASLGKPNLKAIIAGKHGDGVELADHCRTIGIELRVTP